MEERSVGRLYTIDELLELPPPQWLVNDFLQVGTLGMLYSAPGLGKTFVALDLSLHVAAGEPWFGRAVTPGPVVYVSAEGRGGLPSRVRAVLQERPQLQRGNARVMLEPIPFLDPRSAEMLLRRLDGQNMRPVLVVIDTLARCFVGGDENSARDTGVLIDAIGVIQRETGAGVLLLHHSGKPNESNNHRPSERGSSALRGAVDTMIRLHSKSGIIELINEKQKDAAPFDPIKLRLEPVVVKGVLDERGEAITSCVVVPADGPQTVAKDVLSSGARRALDVLTGVPEGLTSRAWREAIERLLGTGIAETTFHRWRRQLLSGKYIEQCTGRDRPYRVISEGATATDVPSAA